MNAAGATNPTSPTGQCNGGNGNNVGFIGGAQAGYNMQMNNFVIGLETDIDGLSRHNGGGQTINATGTTPGYIKGIYQVGGASQESYFGTVRGRLGYAVDRALFFVTGGLAYGDGEGGESVKYWRGGNPNTSNTPTAIFNSNGHSGVDVGWTAGGGVEYAFANHWSFKAEYLYAQMEKGNNGAFKCTSSGGGCNPINSNGVTFHQSGGGSNNLNILRIGVNYKF